MKRCPKCNRTFPEESQKFCTVDGGLLIAEQTYDPNATIRATPAELGMPDSGARATSRELPSLAQTNANAPTVTFPRNTAPTGVPTASEVPPTSPSVSTLPGVEQAPPQAKKKSKLPLILGALALLLLLGVSGVAAVFFFVVKPRLEGFRPEVVSEAPPAEVTNTNTAAENTNTATETVPEATPDEFVPPDDATKFSNSKENLDGKLAEHYINFSFYYPRAWERDPRAGVTGASNFVKVERRLPPDFTQENFAVGWYTSKGSFEADSPTFPQLVELLGDSLSKNFPEYRKVSEGPTKINSLDGYEFRFVSLSKGTEKGDIQVWGRVVFVPTGVAGESAGATLIMLATSLAPELSGVEDVGAKGEMPVILESFRFVKE
jgi:hypothetical protein